jgi:hypothetical protein
MLAGIVLAVAALGVLDRAVALAAPAFAPASGSAPAAAPPAAPSPADPLSVYVLTFGPGDHPFFKFGHNAIWIQDRAARTDLVYNFGTFRFDSPKLIPEFLRGRLTYWLSVSTVEHTLAGYEAENRTIEAQELDLTPAEKRALAERLRVNARPENRSYKYDYFLDNCSTRVRDAVDAAVGGRLKASAGGPARLSLRGQALRLTADFIPEYLALYLALGPSTDRPIDRWAEMFIPQELARGLRAVSLPGAGGAGAASRPLVKAQQVLFRAKRPPPLEQPPERSVTLLLAGLGIALLFVALGGVAASLSLVRFLFGVIVAGWGLVVGLVGCVLLLVWAGTDHQVAFRNQNIWLCAPFALGLFVLGWGVAFGMIGATRKAFFVVAGAALLSLVGALLHLAKVSTQDNAPLIALLVPSWIGLAIGLHSVGRSLRRQGR